jgi:hypothetical protein
MRGALWACMLRWAAGCALALALTVRLEAFGRGSPGLAVLCAAACATFLACGVCVLLVSAYVYVHLIHDRP